MSEKTLRDLPTVFFDCQTTGMRPTNGSLLELGWAWRFEGRPERVESRLLRLPEGESLPAKVSAITGLREADLAGAVGFDDAFRDLDLPANGRPLAVAHYAAFEKAFLEDFFRRQGFAELPFDLVCSQQVAKRLFPQLPSHNIRALAGYFGHPVEELNRAGSHVEATLRIWDALAAELARRGLNTLPELRAWMKDAPTKTDRYEYHMDRLKRLSLPKRPGIYRMLAKSGEVLYVGKATSLKDRVNSYFRGKKGRDPRKLEMLAQVWDLEVVECDSILEASLLENDEIKRLDPPYNVSLKAGDRQLLYYSRDYEDFGFEESPDHPVGPLRPFNHVEQLRRLQFALEGGIFAGLFYVEIPEPDLREGFRLFLEKEGLDWQVFLDLRRSMAVALKLYRRHRAEEPEDAVTAGEPAPDDQLEALETLEFGDETATTYTPEEIAEKFVRLFIRAGEENRRRHRLLRLLDSRVHFETKEGWRSLNFRRGRLETSPGRATPGADLRIDDYDRMCVLLSELAKVPHRIEKTAGLS